MTRHYYIKVKEFQTDDSALQKAVFSLAERRNEKARKLGRMLRHCQSNRPRHQSTQTSLQQGPSADMESTTFEELPPISSGSNKLKSQVSFKSDGHLLHLFHPHIIYTRTFYFMTNQMGYLQPTRTYRLGVPYLRLLQFIHQMTYDSLLI